MLTPCSGEVQLATGEESSTLHAAGDFHVLVATTMGRALLVERKCEEDRVYDVRMFHRSSFPEGANTTVTIEDLGWGESRRASGLSKPSSHTEVQFPGAPLTKSQASS